MYASLFEICPQKARTPHPSGGPPVSDALHLDVFEQPEQQVFFCSLLGLFDQDIEIPLMLHVASGYFRVRSAAPE